MNTYQVLDAIRRRPAMYIGYHSPTHLSSFLNGFDSYPLLNSLNGHNEESDFNGFHDWVAKKLGFSESTSGWANMIAAQRVDQEEALWLFFQLLDEYRGQRPRILAESVYNQNLVPDPAYYNYYGLRGSRATALSKPIPDILS